MSDHSSGSPVGLLAGWGRFPVVFAEKARDACIPVVCVGFRGLASPQLKDICPRFYWNGVARLGYALRRFRREGVKRWVMAGKIHKSIIFAPWRWLTLLPDWWSLSRWYSHSRRDNRDDTLAHALIAAYAEAGLECASALDLCPELLVRPGILTKRKPSAAEEKDIAFGWELAKEMGRLDVGQSVAVRERAVLAVEAIEGTDKAILRAGELCPRGGFVVVKVAKPQQDMRFDVPTVGCQTVEMIRKAGGRVLAIEAGKTILLDEAETVALADRYGITIAAL
jgi:DUF1009 family protein